LFASVLVFTHAPLQSVVPLLHVKPHVPVHVAVAFATDVVHAVPHAPQLFKLLVVSTHVPLQRSGVGAEQPETHVEPAQTGVLPVHRVPHEPQFVALIGTQRRLHRSESLLQLLASSDPESVAPSSGKAPSSSASAAASSPASELIVASSTNASSPESGAYEVDDSDVPSSSPPPEPEELAPELLE